MSANIVTLSTINRVANMLDPLNYEEGDALGMRLQVMNAEAVAVRYQEKPEEPFPYKFSRKFSYSKLEMIKAAHCYIYQCSEGHVPKLDLYKQVRKATKVLEHQFITELPEYDDLPWDFPR